MRTNRGTGSLQWEAGLAVDPYDCAALASPGASGLKPGCVSRPLRCPTAEQLFRPQSGSSDVDLFLWPLANPRARLGSERSNSRQCRGG